MSDILTVTDQASAQLKKIIDISSIRYNWYSCIGIDKSGCNGYSYKLRFCKKK